MFAGSLNWTPRMRTLLSVHPSAQRAPRDHQGGAIYEIPGCNTSKIITAHPILLVKATEAEKTRTTTSVDCPAGEGYSLLRIYDTFQLCKDLTTEPERYESRSIPVENVAECLLSELDGTNTLIAKEGVRNGVCLIEGDTPTQEELDKSRSDLDGYLQALVVKANDLSLKGEGHQIRKQHRVAATYLGMEGASWVKSPTRTVTKPCVFCGEHIEMNALGCKHCSTNIPEFYLKNQSRITIDPNVEGDRVVAFFEQMRVQRGKPKPQQPVPTDFTQFRKGEAKATAIKEHVRQKLDEKEIVEPVGV